MMTTSELSKRLREARERAGFRSASEAARRIGVNVVTYTAHENGGREFDRNAALHYATSYNVPVAWLMFGDRAAVPATDRAPPSGEAHVTPGETKGETPLRAGARAYLADMLEPDLYMSNRLRISSGSAWLLEVQGDSMFDPDNPTLIGSLYPGEVVIVDTDDRTPSPPGPFAIFDGAGVVLKMVEVVPNSSPVAVRMAARNPRYGVYEVKADDLEIVGRVKAKVMRL